MIGSSPGLLPKQLNSNIYPKDIVLLLHAYAACVEIVFEPITSVRMLWINYGEYCVLISVFC